MVQFGLKHPHATIVLPLSHSSKKQREARHNALNKFESFVIRLSFKGSESGRTNMEKKLQLI